MIILLLLQNSTNKFDKICVITSQNDQICENIFFEFFFAILGSNYTGFIKNSKSKSLYYMSTLRLFKQINACIFLLSFKSFKHISQKSS